MAIYDYKKLRLELLKRSARYNAGVKHLYDVAMNDMAREFAMLDYDPNMLFSFENYGLFGRVDGIMSRLERDIQSVVNAAVANEFGAAYEANNELIRKILGDNVSNEVIRAFAPKMSSGNAAKIFNLEHQAGNITESMRVWNGATLGQMETAVQEALMDGMPAKQMAGLMEEYLNDPESCFRRFRIKTGVDADGKSMYGRKWMKRVRNADGSTSWFDADPRDYPTGQGVYHSSYQNALRYTRTTTNIAYRTADYERYQTEDFVLGIEIHITGNPAHKEDICDMLQGRYPKDFKWTGWHPQCYTDDSEVLTGRGWMLFKDVVDDDIILSLNPNTRKLEWVNIVDRQTYEHNGKMVRFFNKSLDCVVTPEHQMVYINKWDGRLKKCTASEYRKGKGGFYRGCEYDAEDIPSITINGKKYNFDIFCEFMAYYLSDGCTQGTSGINIAQKDGQPHKQTIIDCIKSMGYEPKDNGIYLHFYDGKLNSYLKQFGTAKDKYIPKQILNASKRQIEIFLDAYTRCDGYTRIRQDKQFVGNRGNTFVQKKDERLYFSISDIMVRDLTELILKVGHRPSFRKGKVGTSVTSDGRTIKSNYPCWFINECYSTTATVFDKETIDYNGNVYDLTLERNHIMYIRRNGKCFWGSNCMCYEVPILATPEEVNAMADAILNDQDPASVPVAGRVTDVPDNFKQWVADNENRIQDTLDRGKELPYFLRDNGTVVDNKYISNYSLETEENVFKHKTLDELKKEYGDKLPKTLEYLEEAMEKYDRLNDEFIPYREDIEKELFKLFEQNDFGMDISHDVLQSVYDNGFYNQFQSGTSSGALYERGITSGPISKSNGRLWASHKMFGIGNDLEASQLARREYEKYGHLLDKDKLDAFLNNLSGYGDVQVRFKKNKVLCTWTFDDSLGTTYQPSLVTDPRIESLDDLATKYMPKKSDPTKLFEWQELKNTSYIELQYHGELTIDAVESMVFRGSPEKSISMSLIKKLLDKGIELFYYQAGEIHQFVL